MTVSVDRAFAPTPPALPTSLDEAVSLSIPVRIDVPIEDGSEVMQLFPAASASELAASALKALRGPQSWSQSAKLYALMQGDRRNDALLARGIVSQISKALLSGKDSRVEEIIRGLPDTDDAEQILSSLRSKGIPASAQAIVLAALIQQSRTGVRRRRLETALDELLAGGTDWEIALFAWMELGPVDRQTMTEIKSLYQRSGLVRKGLAKFFQQLAGVSQRRKKIRVLIRALGAEISGADDAAPEGARLVSVVRDLKRLLMFLGCEEYCAQIAAGLGPPFVEGEAILRLLIRIFDQPWLYPEWIAKEVKILKLPDAHGFKLARGLTLMVKLLSDPCFRDDEQRKQILETLAAFLDREAA